MTNEQRLRQWLNDPSRSYAEGLLLFVALSSRALRERYEKYFSKRPFPTSASDGRVLMLLDRLRRIAATMPAAKAPSATNKREASVPSAPKPAKQDPLPSDLASRSRLKVVKYDDLPDEQRMQYDQIRALMPLRTRLRTELLAAPDDDSRKDVAHQLVEVDAEMRSLWDRLDNWADGKKIDTETPRMTYDSNALIAALQVAHRRKQLGDNIRTAQMSIARYEKEGRAELLEKARRRLERYEQEREQLERHIADAERH